VPLRDPFIIPQSATLPIGILHQTCNKFKNQLR